MSVRVPISIPPKLEPSSLSDPPPIFRTTNSGFAAAVLAADLMVYAGAEPSPVIRDVSFLLFDTQRQGPELLRQFTAGIFPRVNPKQFLETRAFLQSEVNRVKAGVRREQK